MHILNKVFARINASSFVGRNLRQKTTFVHSRGIKGSSVGSLSLEEELSIVFGDIGSEIGVSRLLCEVSVDNRVELLDLSEFLGVVRGLRGILKLIQDRLNLFHFETSLVIDV